ncbi:MAG: BMP family lipoprotein [Desulfovibrio sp.]
MTRLVKLWLLVIAFLLMFSLPSFAATSPQMTVAFIPGAAGLGDMSFNDMMYGGLRKAQVEYGFKLIISDQGPGGVYDEEKFAKTIEQSDVLVLLGAQFKEVARTKAKLYPEKYWILFEYPIDDIPNLSCVMFAQNEGSYQAGALAASMSQTNKIGFLGGTKILPVESFQLGYIEGAKHVNPEIEIVSTFVSPPGDFLGFTKPDTGFDIAQQMYDNGIDVIFAVAGLTGNGAIECARQRKKFIIGVDSNQDAMAKGYVLTSMIKRLDVATYNEVSKIMEKKFKSGITYYGLESGGVSLSDFEFTKDIIPPAVFKMLDETKTKIISGEIVVPDSFPNK